MHGYKLKPLGVYEVLYTPDFDPITVLTVPEYLKKILTEQGAVNIPVYEPLDFSWTTEIAPVYKPLKIVRIWAERFLRNGTLHNFLFTRDDENALLLRSAFLPGHQQSLQHERAQAFSRGFMDAILRFGV